jgi:hypothetical protein
LKATSEFFIADNEKLYIEYERTENDNKKTKGNPYLIFEDTVQMKKYKEGSAKYIKQLQHITNTNIFIHFILDQVLFL